MLSLGSILIHWPINLPNTIASSGYEFSSGFILMNDDAKTAQFSPSFSLRAWNNTDISLCHAVWLNVELR